MQITGSRYAILGERLEDDNMVDMPEIKEGQDSGLAQDLEGHPYNPILLENFQNCIEKEINSIDCDSSIMIKDVAQATS